jgi:hypothetical protein
MSDEDYAPVWDDLLQVADGIEVGAAELQNFGDRVEEILPTRMDGHLTTPAEWAAEKYAAARAAHAYVAGLRAEAAEQLGVSPGPDRERYEQAGWVKVGCGQGKADTRHELILQSVSAARRGVAVFYGSWRCRQSTATFFDPCGLISTGLRRLWRDIDRADRVSAVQAAVVRARVARVLHAAAGRGGVGA